jgi:AP-1-like factor
MSRPNSQLTPAQQDLLLAALASNSKPSQSQRPSTATRGSSRNPMSDNKSKNSLQTSPLSSHFDFGPDDSPYLDFDIDGEGDDSFDFDGQDQMIGDLPETSGELHDKRKSIDGKDDDEGGGKRRESEDKASKKPGRKPLTSEPTTVSIDDLSHVNGSDFASRNVKRRIGPPNEHSENERRNISKISRLR